MTNFVTYAQNFEDVMLWRALQGVTDGFYIDVGAADPDEDSVTRAFYDRGWHGINIEPAPSYFAALLAARPRDTTLQCLVGAAQGEAELHHFGDTGLSTMNADFAARHVAEGRAREVVRLEVLPLSEIWTRHAPEIVHFVKIDVEGAEAEVLRGADISRHRPWIILAEATEPGSKTENWTGWEGLLTGAEYRFAWFDGLNRFYIAAEHWDRLHAAFGTPPNVFDLWIQPRGKQQRALIERGEQAVSAVRAAADQAVQAMQTELVAVRADAMRIPAIEGELADLRGQLLRAQAGAARAEAAEGELARLQGQLLEARAGAARADAAEGELADTRGQLLAQQRAAADLRHRVIAVEAGRLEARAEIGQLRVEAAREQGESARMRTELCHARQESERRDEALRAMYASTSWRITAPMRDAVTLARFVWRRGVRRLAGGGRSAALAGAGPPASVQPVTVSPQIPVGEAAASPASSEERRILARLHAFARSR